MSNETNSEEYKPIVLNHFRVCKLSGGACIHTLRECEHKQVPDQGIKIALKDCPKGYDKEVSCSE